MKVENYNDILGELRKKNRNLNLLMGNGFSISYDHTIFSYNALQGFIDKLNDPVLDKLFKIVRSKNLEVIMQQLRVLSELLDAFEDDGKLKTNVLLADKKLRKGLIDAVQSLHPEHVFTVPDKQIQACSKFLMPYLEPKGNIFTTNYDILLYWVLMRSGCKNAIDGFGYERENPEETNPDEFEYSSVLTWGQILESKMFIIYMEHSIFLIVVLILKKKPMMEMVIFLSTLKKEWKWRSILYL